MSQTNIFFFQKPSRSVNTMSTVFQMRFVGINRPAHARTITSSLGLTITTNV